MASLNKVTLIGNLGRDPEIRFLQDGKTAVCKTALATSEKWVDKKTNEPKESVEWHRLTIWGKLAENFHKYMKKGSSVYVEGKLKTSSYEKEGQRHYSTEILVEKVIFLSKAASSSEKSSEKKEDEGPPGYMDSSEESSNSQDDDIPF